MSDFVDSYRKAAPNDTRSDEELTQAFGDQLSPAALDANPDLKADYLKGQLEMRKAFAPPTLLGKAKRGAARGIDTAQAQMYSTAGWAGDLIGSDTVKDWGLAGYNRNLQEAAQNPPTFQSISQVGGLGDLINYGTELAAEQVPQFAGTAAASIAGGLAGSALGPEGTAAGALGGAAEALAAAAAVKKAVQLGSFLGGSAFGFTQMNNYGDLAQTPGISRGDLLATSGLVGAVGAALEAAPFANVLAKSAKTLAPSMARLTEKEAATAYGKVLQKVPKYALPALQHAAAEGSTEVLQELTSIAGEEHANRDNPDFKLSSQQIMDRLIANGGAGFVLGAGLGAFHRGHEAEAPPAVAPAAPTGIAAQIQATGAATLPSGNMVIQTGTTQMAAAQTASAAPAPYVDPAVQALREQMAANGLPTTPTAPETIFPAPVPIIEPQPQEPNATQTGQVQGDTGIQHQEAQIARPADQAGVPTGERVLEQAPAQEVAAPVPPVVNESLTTPASTEASPVEVLPPEPVAPTIQPGLTVQERDHPLIGLIDYDNSSLKKEIAKRGVATDEETHQPGQVFDPLHPADAEGRALEQPFFTLKGSEGLTYTPELAQRLVSSANPTSDHASTRRMTFFENADGEVFGLPTWAQHKGGETRYYVAPAKEGSKATQLKDFMAAGNTPMASARLTEPVAGRKSEKAFLFNDYQEFERQIVRPSEMQMRELGKYAPTMQAGMANVIHTAEGQAIEIQNKDTMPEAQAARFTDAMMEILPTEMVGGERVPARGLSLGDIGNRINFLLSNKEWAPSVMDQYRQILARIAGNKTESQQFNALDQAHQAEYLHRDLANRIYGAIKETHSLLVQQGNAPSQLGTGGGSFGEALYSKPKTIRDFRASNGEIKSRFNQIIEALRNFGLGVDVLSAIKDEMGKFSNKDNLVTLTMFDAENPSPENLRMLMHESVHAIMADAPVQVREQIYNAIENLSDAELGLIGNNDPRISEANPTALSQPVLNAERLAKRMELFGLPTVAARGVANEIVRFVKDLYFRTAIAIQKIFGRTPSLALARAYVENRFSQILAGDRKSLFNFMIPPGVIGEDLFSKPVDRIGEKGKAVPDLAISTHNTIKAMQTAIDPALKNIGIVTTEAARQNKTPVEFLRSILRMDNPDDGIKAEMLRVDPLTGQPTGANPNQTVAGYQDKSAAQIAGIKSFQAVTEVQQKAMAKDAQLSGADGKVETVKKARDKANVEFARLTKDYTNMQGLTMILLGNFRNAIKQSIKDVSGLSIKLGAITQQLRMMDQRPQLLRRYAPVFRKLFTGNEIKGEPLFRYLSDAVNEGIDFTKPWWQIEKDMIASGAPVFSPLFHNTETSRALFAAVVAFGKTNTNVSAAIALARSTATADRIKINAALQALSASDVRSAGLDARAIANTAITENALFKETVAARVEAKAKEKQLKTLEAEQAAVQAALPYLRKTLDDLGGPAGIHAPVVYGHGMEYQVPNAAGTMDTKMVALDTSTGKPTNMAQLKADYSAMVNWVDSASPSVQRNQVEAQTSQIFQHAFVGDDIRKTEKPIWSLLMESLGNQLQAIGTPAARSLAQMTFKMAQYKRTVHDTLFAHGIANDRIAQQLAKSARMTIAEFDASYFNKAIGVIERASDLREQFPNNESAIMAGVMKRVRSEILADQELAKRLVGKEAKFFADIQKLLQLNVTSSGFGPAFLDAHNVRVTDENIEVQDSKGKFITAVRKHVNLGAFMFPRSINDNFHNDFNALKNAGWAAASPTFGQAVDQINRTGLIGFKNLVAPFFAGDIKEGFAKEHTQIDTVSHFDGPKGASGTAMEVSPAKVRAAADGIFEKGGTGDVFQFINNLSALMNGRTQATPEYIQDVLMKFANLFERMNGIESKINPAQMAVDTFKQMVPGFMVNARELDGLPAAYTTAIRFGKAAVGNVSTHLAAEAAFGAKGENFTNVFATLTREAQADVDKLAQAKAYVDRFFPGLKPKEYRAEMEKKVGGKEELKRLERQKDVSRFALGNNNALKQMTEYLQKKPQGVVKAALQAFTFGMINGPGSALYQFTEAFGPILSFGASPSEIKKALRMAVHTPLDIAGGLAHALGITLERKDRLQKVFNDLNLSETDVSLKLKDLFHQTESAYTRTDYGSRALHYATNVFRFLPEVAKLPLNLSGKTNPFTSARLTAPFLWVSNSFERGATVGMFEAMEGYVLKAKAAMDTKGGAIDWANLPMADWAKQIGLGKADGAAFQKIAARASEDWGLNFHNLALEAAKNVAKGNENVLNKETYRTLASMVTKEFGTQSNISNMPAATFNNLWLSAIMPLQGWPLRRTSTLLNLRFNEQDKAEYAALAKGLAGLAVAVAGGLAVSMLEDLYKDDILQKRRNLRRLTLDQTPGNIALAVLEHSARTGVFGFGGDIANAAVNVGQSGDNRPVSIDGRVVLASSIIGFLKTISTYVNQGFTADYANVVRPLGLTLGLNGPLEMTDIVNRVFGLDNVESEAVRRTNISNWLRVVGRETGLEVRTSTGGYSTPTPMSPLVARLQLAALAGNASDFQTAYREALAQAKEQKSEDPIKTVGAAFSSRNPLRGTFQNPLTRQQYNAIMSALPDDARADITAAVRSFDNFGAQIGVTPFTFHGESRSGAAPKTFDQTMRAALKMPTPVDMNAILRRAAAF